MSEGIRATVEFPDPSPCRVAEASRATDSVVERVHNSVITPEGSPTVTEFVVEAAEPPALDDCTHVLSVGGRHVLRFDHDREASCPCECLGEFGCPANRYVADGGRLRLVFDAAGYDELEAVVGALRECFSDLDVRRLVRSPGATEAEDEVFVDRGKLTARQREVLETAYRRGYFERPRGVNATELAAELDLNPSTVAEHLAAAQSKLLGDLLGDD